MESIKHKIFFKSDFHIDLHDSEPSMDYIKDFVKTSLNDLDLIDKPILILGGDYADDSETTLKLIKEYAKYSEKVFIVFGNHDYYIYSKNDLELFGLDSKAKINYMIDSLSEVGNVTVLQNFEIIKYKDLTISGDMFWYSVDSYLEKRTFNLMRDSECIFNLNIPTEHSVSKYNYNELPNEYIDIIVTHVPTLVTNSNHRFGKECFSNPVTELKADIYCFGHVHENEIYDKAGSIFYSNAYSKSNKKFIKLDF